MPEIKCLNPDQLQIFLDRHRKVDPEVRDFNFQNAITKVVEELKELVPSEGIFVLLDEPSHFLEDEKPRNLTYVAGYGDKVSQIVGLKTIATQGLISQAYKTGSMQLIKAQSGEASVLDKIHLPQSVKDAVCNPLKLTRMPLGVLVLYNKQDPMGYTMKDIRMINIFSSYLCMSMNSAIDAKKNKELAKRDNLTGLFNDRYFHMQLEKEIITAEKNKTDLCLMFMDLDNFKSINDQHGHLVGSQTLKEVGFVLREVFQVPNATIARYGGDEYVCVLPGVTLQQAEKLGNQLREKIFEKMFMVDRGYDDGSFISFKGAISASVGIASLNDHVPPQELRHRKNALVRLADQAMYDAKALGKNQVCIAKVTN